MPAKPRTSQTVDQRLERGHVRAFAGAPTSVDEATRSFDIVITTETPVRRCIPDPRLAPTSDTCVYIEVDEVLVAAGVDLSRTPRKPLIDCHDTYSGIEKILGKIDDVRVEGQAVVGRASLARKHAELLPDIIDGYFGQISAGYDYDLRRDTELVERDGDVPLLLVKRWLLTEGSLVPAGADPNSFIRSLAGSRAAPEAAATPNTQEKTMDLEELVAAAEAALAAVDEAAGAEETVSDELAERIRALRADPAAAEEDTSAAAEEEKKPDTAAEGERADDAEMTDEEKKDVENVRSIAKGYGLEQLVTDMRALGSKPAQIRAAVSKSIAERGAPAASDPVVVKTPVRSAVATFNPNAVYEARRNTR